MHALARLHLEQCKPCVTMDKVKRIWFILYLRSLCSLFFEQVYCSCSQSWHLDSKRRPHGPHGMLSVTSTHFEYRQATPGAQLTNIANFSEESAKSQTLVTLAHFEIISDLMAKLRHSRTMIELFGDDHAKDLNEGKSSPVIPCKSTLTDSGSRYGGHKFTTSNFLRLITKHTATDILL